MGMRFVWAVVASAMFLAWSVAAVRAWEPLLTGVAREAPACVSWTQGRIDCLVRLSTGRLAWLAFENGKWAAPQDLGGALPVAVSCVVRGPGGINCFAPTAKGVLAEIHLNGTKWSAWTSLGGDLAASPASCLSSAKDRMVCYARGREGQLYARAWSGGATWDEWRDLGGALTGAPACLFISFGRVACFARGPGGQLVAMLPEPSGKSWTWQTIGGRIEGRPSCASIGGEDVACAVRSADDKLLLWNGRAVSGKATARLRATGDVASDDPACVMTRGVFTCFTRNASKRLIRHALAANGALPPSPPIVIGSPLSTASSCTTYGPGSVACFMTNADRQLLFGAGPDLEEPKDAEAALAIGTDDNPLGSWYLSNIETDEVCRVHLLDEPAGDGRRLELEPECGHLPGLARAYQWTREADQIEFLTRRGRPIVAFRLTASSRWISPGRDGSYLLSREPADEPRAEQQPRPRVEPLTPADVTGAWRLTVEINGRICGVRLTDWPAGAGYAALVRGGCAPDLMAVQSWSFDDDALVLVGTTGRVIARFNRESKTLWRAENAQGVGSYTLAR